MGTRTNFNGCSFLWVTNSGASEITANSIASLQRLLQNREHSLFVGTLDAVSEREICGYTDCSGVQFFRLDQETTWRSSKINLSSEYVDWGTQDFRLICKAKYFAISKVLQETGKPLVFADGDIAFLRNPVELFESNRAIDCNMVLAQNDRDLKYCNGIFDDQYPPGLRPDGSEICAGFTCWQPTRRHLKMAEYVGKNVTADVCDQMVFNRLPFWKRRHVQLLPMDLFPNGSLAFGNPDNQFEDKYIVHANWRIGLDSKLQALKEDGYWFI